LKSDHGEEWGTPAVMEQHKTAEEVMEGIRKKEPRYKQ